MHKPKVYITRHIPEQGLNMIFAACDAQVWPDENPPPHEILIEKVRGINGLLCLLNDSIDGEIMDAAGPELKIISNYAVGYDNIDIQAATERDILVGNTPGILTETTADLAFTLIMAAGRRIVEAGDYIRAGKWKTFKPEALLGQDIYGSTLGIIGMGRIGAAVAERARGFDMKVICFDRNVQPQKMAIVGVEMRHSLDDLLAEADFVSLHVPLTTETYRLIDSAALAKMKHTAILVNTSRGQVVDSDALYEALHSGQITYAALDVTDPEPLPSGHKLLSLPNCLVVPHIGSASVATRSRMSVMAAENLIAGISGGVPPHIVNK